MEYETVKQDLRRAYDAEAAARDGMADPDWKRSERSAFADRLREAGAVRVLEIGAGHGVSGRYFADEGFEVVCVDLSPALVERCRARGLEAAVMDFADLRFDDGSFDAVFGMNCLLHVPRRELGGVLGEVDRVLSPGGLFYWGQYGGLDSEGVWPDDAYEPKRFFSFMTADRIRSVAEERFDLLDFASVRLEYAIPEYQGLSLRSRN